MSHIVIKGSNHQEWLDARKGGIGSSEVATLLGVNPWQTPYQLWLAKRNPSAAEEKESFLMKAGHYLEDAVSKFCADETGLEIIKSSAAEFVVINRERPYLRVSPDRYAWMPYEKHTKDNKVIIECKTTQNTIDEDSFPEYWFCQVMYQMGVCEMEKAVVAWLTQGRQFGYKWLNFDKDFYNDVIVAEVERFWTDNIIGGKEPALSDINDVLLKYPNNVSGKSVDVTEEILAVYNELKNTNEEIKRLTALKKDAETQIKALMQDAEMLVIPASNDNPRRVIATWKNAKDGESFNEAAFKEDNPVMYASYCNPKPGQRRFLIK